jgi:hypothetical protein
MKTRRAVAVASAALLAQAACASTSYTPRADGRIAMALQDGRQVLIKDGKTYPFGGDGLQQAVAGNPPAEEHARSYSSDMHFALAEELIGLGALIAGAVVAAPSQDANGNNLPVSTERQTAGGIMGIAGLVVLIVAAFQIGSAQGHFMDAVNVYNDGVPPRLPPPPPGWQPQSPVPLPAPANPPAAPPPQAYPPPPDAPKPVAPQ